MNHQLSLGREESPALGQNVPPDAGEQLPAPLSLFHPEEWGRGDKGAAASESVNAAWLGPCWGCQACTSGLRNAGPQDGLPASAASCS